MTTKNEIKEKFETVFSVPNLKSAFNFQNYHLSKFQNTLKELGIVEKRFFMDHGKAFLFELKRIMENEEYHPDKPLFYRVPKSIGCHRVITHLSLSDSTIYQALFSKHWLGKVIDKKLASVVYGNRVNFSSKNKRYLRDYRTLRNSFIYFQQKAITEGYGWRLELDVSNFYPSIQHKDLFRILRTHFNEYPKLVDLLERQLTLWFPSGRGIPQGHQASSVLANAFLFPLDKSFGNMGGRYARYGDDLVFLFKTPEQARICADQISRLLLDLDLQTNSKTSLKYYNNSSDLNPLHLATDYLYLDGEKFDLAEVQQLMETSASLEDNFQKLKNFENLEKHELTRLKFFLRSGGIFDDNHDQQVLEAFFFSSELSFYSADYLSKRIPTDRLLFKYFLNRYKSDFKMMTSWQKYNGAALLLSSLEIKKHDRLQTLSSLTTNEDVWELGFLSFVMSLSNSKNNRDQICSKYQRHFGGSEYIVYLCSSVFNPNFCHTLFDAGKKEIGTFQNLLHVILVGSKLGIKNVDTQQNSKKTENTLKTDMHNQEKIDKIFDIVTAIGNQIIRIPKTIFALEKESAEYFSVSCHGHLNDYVFDKKEKWVHLCHQLVWLYQKGYPPVIRNDSLISYLQDRHALHDFKYPPFHRTQKDLRSAVRELVRTANKNFPKCAPQLLLRKKVFDQNTNPGSVTLLLEELKGQPRL